jgi:hypothetical protein
MIFLSVFSVFYVMVDAFVSVPKVEYEMLVEKAKIADDAIVQLRMSLEDLRLGRVSRFL